MQLCLGKANEVQIDSIKPHPKYRYVYVKYRNANILYREYTSILFRARLRLTFLLEQKPIITILVALLVVCIQSLGASLKDYERTDS